MNIKLLLLGFAILTSCKTTLPTATTSLTPTLLFNGKDLSGWTIYGTEKWYVEDSLLVCENGQEEGFGYLGTNKDYKSFELNVEFKQETPKSNGGVFIHSELEGTDIDGWQVEIGPPGHQAGGIHRYDSGWLIKPDPIKDEALKMGEWNHLKIRVAGDKMVVWLNGTEMSSLVDPKIEASEGLVALQIHKGNVNKLRWRNIEISEL